MTNDQQPLILRQKRFPFDKKEIVLDPQKNKITITSESLFRREVIEEDLINLNENIHQFKIKSFKWIIISIISTIYLIVCLHSWISNTYEPSKISFIIFWQSLLFVGVCYSWMNIFKSNLNILSIRLKNLDYNIILFQDNPNKEIFESFIKKLREMMANSHDKLSIQSLLQQLPTNVLINEFSSSYIYELTKRDIDVINYLTFLQKFLINEKTNKDNEPL